MDNEAKRGFILGFTAFVVLNALMELLVPNLVEPNMAIPRAASPLLEWVLPLALCCWLARKGGPADQGWFGTADALERSYPWVGAVAAVLSLAVGLVTGVMALLWVASGCGVVTAVLLLLRAGQQRRNTEGRP